MIILGSQSSTEARSTTRVHGVPACTRLLNGRNRRALADLGDSTVDVYRYVIQNGVLGKQCRLIVDTFNET